MNNLEANKKPITLDLAKTIEYLMETRNINMNQLHKKTGVPVTTINRLLNEKNANPTISSLIPIANFFEITLNQLMGIDPSNLDPLIDKYAPKNSLWRNVPIISWERAAEWSANISTANISETISTDILLGNNPYALIISESNWEGFFPNSVIIIDSSILPDHGDYAVILKKGQKRASLKQILIDDDKTYLRPVNKDYQTQILDESYELLGVVVQIRMDRK